MATQAWIAGAASVFLVAALEVWASPLGVMTAAGLLTAWGTAMHHRLIAELR